MATTQKNAKDLSVNLAVAQFLALNGDGELGLMAAMADVIAPVPTGTAATDLANLQAAIDDTPEFGRLFIPGDPSSDGHYVIDDALSVSKSIVIDGKSAWEAFSTTLDFPASPYIRGSVIRQVTAAKDGIVFSDNISPRISHLGIVFDDDIDGDTGHGFKSAPTTATGLHGFALNDCIVAGHDGDHYAFYLNNPLYGQLMMPRAYGGGGIFLGCSSTGGNLGNSLIVQPVMIVFKEGSAHGYAHSSSGDAGDATGVLNLITYIRPQCNVSTSTANNQHVWKDDLGDGTPLNIVAINPDLENGPGKSSKIVQGAGTEFIGGVQINPGGARNCTRYGYGAMPNPAGGFNSAFGQGALKALTTGNNNVAVGDSSLDALTTGAKNVAIGSGALGANNNQFNVAVGYNALGPTTGWKNTAIGNAAGPSTAARDLTTSIGYGASADANGAVAIGADSSGNGASATAQNEFALGTEKHQIKISNNTTGSGSAALGSNSPATVNTAPYTWFKMKAEDGTTVYVPAWK